MLHTIELEGGARALRSPALMRRGVPHAFTTRRGPSGASWDVGALDDGAHALLAAASGSALEQLSELRQVHGADVHWATKTPPAAPPAADAQLGTDARLGLLVRTADCVPLLLASEDGACVAAVHAGWRGQVAGVIPRALAAMEERGTPARVGAIGPCLSLERFEVGEEVAQAFEAAGLGACVTRALGPKPHVDLRAATLRQLEVGGLSEVDLCERCTWDDPELWSYRRDVTHGERTHTGRLGALIAPTG